MKAITEEAAKEKMCPFCYVEIGSRNVNRECIGSECMAWNTTKPEMKRENHSGHETRVMQAVSDRGLSIKDVTKEGVGTDAVFTVPAVGVCLRLVNNQS